MPKLFENCRLPPRLLPFRLFAGFAALLLLFPTNHFPFDDFATSYQVGSSRIDIEVDRPDSLSVSKQDLLEWAHSASDSVANYYGRYPVPHVALRIIPTDGRGIRGGKTFPESDGGSIRIHVGTKTIKAGLETDWMLTHEMVHLAFPSVADEHHWIEEGLSTYVEPIARVRAGNLDVHQMWFEVMRDLHQGLPEDDDKGLDHTHTWARTYWGGALFCFLADVEIHRHTNNRKGLDDALRGILDAGGDIRSDWKLTDALRIGDKAAGVAVLVPLYDKMKDQPYDVDLPALWMDLGVERSGDTVTFNDKAPLANVRRAITYGQSERLQSH
ncbi:MAG TPA: hypothetical protein VMJ35_02745 [Dongiaceae bacterium]|nr:hypothetical protein [Dongiaceae bacterium]